MGGYRRKPIVPFWNCVPDFAGQIMPAFTSFLPVWLDCVANVGRHRTISERTRDRFDRDEPPPETEFEPHPGVDQEKPTHMASRVTALSIQTTESRASSNSCVVIRALAGATKR